MDQQYEVAKWIWTDTDFEQMGWHDCRIHALAFSPDDSKLLFDLDYILAWVGPVHEDGYYRFWVAPATLVFENVYDISFDIESCGSLEISGIQRKDPKRPRNADFIQRDQEWLWVVECQQGEISFRATGFKQYIRAMPSYDRAQVLALEKRAGFSFALCRTDRLGDA